MHKEPSRASFAAVRESNEIMHIQCLAHSRCSGNDSSRQGSPVQGIPRSPALGRAPHAGSPTLALMLHRPLLQALITFRPGVCVFVPHRVETLPLTGSGSVPRPERINCALRSGPGHQVIISRFSTPRTFSLPVHLSCFLREISASPTELLSLGPPAPPATGGHTPAGSPGALLGEPGLTAHQGGLPGATRPHRG